MKQQLNFESMDTTTAKKELADWIKSLDDESLLGYLLALKKGQPGRVLWDELPQATKDSIERAEKNIEDGQITPHQEVRKSYEELL